MDAKQHIWATTRNQKFNFWEAYCFPFVMINHLAFVRTNGNIIPDRINFGIYFLKHN